MEKNYRKIWGCGLLIILLSLWQTSGFSQNFDWAKREGAFAYDYGYGTTTDMYGNVYVAGKFEQNAVFSDDTVKCYGNHDIYLAKYSPKGELIWIRTAGGPFGDYAHTVVCDGTKYVYIAGEVEDVGPFTFDAKTQIKGHGENDCFVAKYDLDGNVIWARDFGGPKSDKAQSVAFDGTGNVYVTGKFTETLDFGGAQVNGKGSADFFIAKFDKDGHYISIKTGGGAGRDEGMNLVTDSDGNLYACGMFSGGASFEGQSMSCKGYLDIFIIKMNPKGNVVWIKTAGGGSLDEAWSMTINKSNKLFITGEFGGSVNFGGKTVSSSGGSDVFVAGYDLDGNVLWVSKGGSSLSDRARGIATDGENLYITGQYGWTGYFGGTKLNASDSSDVFVASLTSSGSWRWALSVDGSPDSYDEMGFESGISIAAVPTGNIYVTGALLSGGNFGGRALPEYGRTDVFLTKITQPGSSDPKVDVVNVNKIFKGDFSIFPNPTSGNSYLVLPKTDQSVLITITDVLGQRIQTKTIAAGTDRYELNFPATGLYFVELRMGDQRKVLKAIKN